LYTKDFPFLCNYLKREESIVLRVSVYLQHGRKKISICNEQMGKISTFLYQIQRKKRVYFYFCEL
jgi:hypothetical protein